MTVRDLKDALNAASNDDSMEVNIVLRDDLATWFYETFDVRVDKHEYITPRGIVSKRIVEIVI